MIILGSLAPAHCVEVAHFVAWQWLEYFQIVSKLVCKCLWRLFARKEWLKFRIGAWGICVMFLKQTPRVMGICFEFATSIYPHLSVASTSTWSVYNCSPWRIRNMLIKLSLHTLQLICIVLTHPHSQGHGSLLSGMQPDTHFLKNIHFLYTC